LIGLVDRNTINYSASNATMSISISGRDLSKLLIDDGTYYLAAPGITPEEGVFKNDDPENWGRAWRGKGEFLIPQQTNDKSQIFWSIFGDSSLQNIMIHLFSTFATVEVCPDEVFRAYETKNGGERASEYTYYDPIEKKNKIFKGAGIWKIIKVLVNDEGVRDRVIVDKSLAVHEGSLMAAVKKYAQEPFVEMISDTYGDMYYHIFRRPPYDEKGFRSMVDLIDELSFENSEDNPLIIKESEIISDTLQFYDGDVYCWYRLIPMKYDGENQDANYNNQLPIIYFREYNEIWGNRKYEQYDNYLPYNEKADNLKDPKVEIRTAKMLEDDLRFVIESNSYLPFTRRGSITINMDRRIKKGVVIRHEGTREVFLVDAVSHSCTVSEGRVDATTTLQVSRGMVEKDEKGNDVLDLYFNIIHFGQTTKSTNAPQDDKKENKKILQVYFDTDKPYLLVVEEANLIKGDETNIKIRQQFHDKSKKAIEQVVNDLVDNQNLSVKIVGHTDIRSTSFPGGNENLSLQRAKSVVENLKLSFKEKNNGLEIDNNRVSFDGVGSKEPYNGKDNTISIERQQELDRRVEVIYTYDTKSKQKAVQPVETNPYSNWYVNQSIFNFFMKRRQFCSEIVPVDALISSHNLRQSGKKLEIVPDSTIQNVKNTSSNKSNQ
jgi:outer membrane protein OmpA-like peptidoglycan-associated protein